MAASLDGFIARKDGSVDWLETSDEFAGGDTLDPEFVESFLKTIDCYVMGSRTYETALNFEAKGFGWAYGDKPTFILTSRDLPRTRDTVEFYSGDPKHVEMMLLKQPSTSDLELEKDTISLYQVADDLYMHDRYRIDERGARQLNGDRGDQAQRRDVHAIEKGLRPLALMHQLDDPV